MESRTVDDDRKSRSGEVHKIYLAFNISALNNAIDDYFVTIPYIDELYSSHSSTTFPY